MVRVVTRVHSGLKPVQIASVLPMIGDMSAVASPGLGHKILSAFPRLRGLPYDEWAPRHTVIVSLIVLHIPAVIFYGIAEGMSAPHLVAETVGLLGLFAALASWNALSQSTRSCAAAAGLIFASALVVHVSGGSIAAHFHFFIVLPIIGLYLDWRPFAVAVGLIVVHHLFFALLVPASVFGHGQSTGSIVKQTLIHAAYVVVQVAALLASWKLAEKQEEVLQRRNAEMDRRKEELEAKNAELDGTISRLDRTVSEMRRLSERVGAHAEQVAATGEQLAAEAGGTHEAAERSAAALDAVRLSAEALDEAADAAAREAARVVEETLATTTATSEGSSAMDELVKDMDEVGTRVGGIADGVASLTERTRKVAVIVDTVRQLADQSRLLALNASIEAARAGEHGRGFAVVAEEVRKLAEESNAATESVDELLSDIERAAQDAITAARSGVDSVERGKQTATRTEEALRAIAHAGDAVHESAESISSAAGRSRAVGQEIGAGVQQVAAAISEVTTSADEVSGLANRLRELAAELDALTAAGDGGEEYADQDALAELAELTGINGPAPDVQSEADDQRVTP